MKRFGKRTRLLFHPLVTIALIIKGLPAIRFERSPFGWTADLEYSCAINYPFFKAIWFLLNPAEHWIQAAWRADYYLKLRVWESDSE